MRPQNRYSTSLCFSAEVNLLGARLDLASRRRSLRLELSGAEIEVAGEEKRKFGWRLPGSGARLAVSEQAKGPARAPGAPGIPRAAAAAGAAEEDCVWRSGWQKGE